MPFRTTFSPIRVRRVLAAAAALLLVCALIAGRQVGRWLVNDEPLVHADAIYVLAGSAADRIVEAGDLLLAGWAPRIVLSAEIRDGGERELERRGLHLPSRSEMQKDLLVRMGVAADAVIVLPAVHNTTGDEAATLAALIRERGWRRVIVVTSKLHTRRAGWIMRRAVSGTGAAIVMRASRLDLADPDHWWRDHSDRRFVLFETQKLLAYSLGLD